MASWPRSLRESIDAGNLLFGASRCTSAARLSKVAYTVPAWRPSAEVGGSAVGVCDVVAIFQRARAIQIFKKSTFVASTSPCDGVAFLPRARDIQTSRKKRKDTSKECVLNGKIIVIIITSGCKRPSGSA